MSAAAVVATTEPLVITQPAFFPSSLIQGFHHVVVLCGSNQSPERKAFVYDDRRSGQGYALVLGAEWLLGKYPVVYADLLQRFLTDSFSTGFDMLERPYYQVGPVRTLKQIKKYAVRLSYHFEKSKWFWYLGFQSKIPSEDDISGLITYLSTGGFVAMSGGLIVRDSYLYADGLLLGLNADRA